MASILAIGIATLDIINTVADYPAEDSETRAVSQTKARGGNATNTLVVLSQLGHLCHWAGVLINEPDGQFICDDLDHYTIDHSACRLFDQGKIPTSYITRNQQTASRTIVHYRDCPEYSFDDFKNNDLSQFDWLHFEGRNVDETRKMMLYAADYYPMIPRSLEIEKARDGIEPLFDLASVLFFSKDYALSHGFDNAVSLLKKITKNRPYDASCTWGEQGAWAITKTADIYHSQAETTAPVIDTLAAGDTFNAAMINSLINGQPMERALTQACQLASYKCQHQGLENLITEFNTYR